MARINYKVSAFTKRAGTPDVCLESETRTAHITGPTTVEDLLRMVADGGVLVPGTSHLLNNCPLWVVVEPASAWDASEAVAVCAPHRSYLIPPTARGGMRRALADVGDELTRARGAFRPMISAHEGFAILKEEVDELWDEVRKSPRYWEQAATGLQTPDAMRLDALRREAVQVAAMAVRFMLDVCDSQDETVRP